MDTDLADWLDHADEDTRTELAHVWIEEQQGDFGGLYRKFLVAMLAPDSEDNGYLLGDGELWDVVGYENIQDILSPEWRQYGEQKWREAMRSFVAYLTDDGWTEFRTAILDNPPDIAYTWAKYWCEECEEARRDNEQATRESMAGVAERGDRGARR